MAHFRALGMPVIIEPAPPPLDQFERAVLQLSLPRKVDVAIRVFVPYTLRLARRFRQLAVKIVHTADLRGHLLAAPAAHFAGAAVIAHFRGEFGGIPKLYIVAGAALSHRMILVSPNVWRVIPKALHARCVEVSDPVLPPAPRPLPRRDEVLGALSAPLALGDRDLLLVSVGTLVPQKGAHRLLEALRLAGPRVDSASPGRRLGVVFVGKTPDEPYRRFICERVREWGLRDVRILGWAPDDLVDGLYRVADLACFPGVQHEELEIEGQRRLVRCLDALPRAVTEPMSYGVTVIATSVAGIEKAIVDGENGILVPPSDTGALASALVRVAQDEELRSRLGRAGAESILTTCSMESHLTRVSALYDELLRMQAPGARSD